MGISKERKNFGIVLAVIFGLYIISISVLRLTGAAQEGASGIYMAAGLGGMALVFSIIEIIGAVLLMVPKTASLGTLLLVAYFGIESGLYLSQGQSLLLSIVMMLIVLMIARIKNPEMYQSLRKG